MKFRILSWLRGLRQQWVTRNRLHRHHVIPKHAGGGDHPSNIVVLSIGAHARAHLKLWRSFRRWQDLVAYRALSGYISASVAQLLAQRLGARQGGLNCKGTPKPPRTDQFIQKQRESHLGFSFLTPEGSAKISEALTGNKHAAGAEPWNKGKTGVS